MEPGQRAAPGHRQARPRRPRLHADHVRRLRLAAAVPADRHPRPARPCWCRPNPGNVSAFGLLTVDVKNDYVQTNVALADQLDPAAVAAVYDALTAQAAERADQGGLRAGRAPVRPHRRPALLRPGLRGAGRRSRTGRSTPPSLDDGRRRASTPSTRALYGYDFAGDPTQQVEWVNLRVSGIGPIQRPEIQRARRGRLDGAHRRCADRHRDRSASTPPTGTSTRRCYWRPDLRAGDGASTGPAIIEEFGSTVPLHPGFVRPRSTSTSTSS